MRRESKIARVETVSVGIGFNQNSLINIGRARIDNDNKSNHVEKKKSA